MTNVWGNPELKSFKNNYIRRVIVDMARVFVHRNLVPSVEELLMRASEHGAIFSHDNLPAVLPSLDLDDSMDARLGLKLQIPDFFVEMPVDDLKFKQVGDIFIYNGDPITAKTVESVPQFTEEIENALIGTKQLGLGNKGRDVKFLAYFFGMPEPSQYLQFDAQMGEAVSYFQKRMGIPVTGVVDSYTWQAILPKGSERIAGGYAGLRTRALQAALMVNGYKCPVDSRFGTETVRAVREFQVSRKLRVTGRIGYLEWKELFDLK